MLAVGCSAPVESAPPSGGVSDTFTRAQVVVAGETWDVAVAGTPTLRRRGLRGVSSLGDLDGMLFVFSDDATARFTMQDTLIPLDIAFFSAEGSYVSGVTMVPCDTEPCPDYSAAGPYRYALEAPAGRLSGIASPTLDVSSLP